MASTRPYRQTRRAETATVTRHAIIEATRETLAARPLRSPSVGEVAAAAGVARSTVYEVFGDRAGLFRAVAEDLLERGGFGRLQRAHRDPDAVRALEESLRVFARLIAGQEAVGGALLSLAAVDPDAAVATERLEHGRLDGMRDLARRLRRQGALRSDVSTAEAVDVLWMITNAETFRQLHEGRGLGYRAIAERLLWIARRTLLHAADTPRPGPKTRNVSGV